MMAWLADGLVDRGHEVTIIGVGAPGTRASFIPTFEEAQFPRLGECLPESLHVATAARILDDLAVDVVHDHTCAGPLGATRRHAPTVLTAHGPATGELGSYYELLADETSVVAISQAQRAEAPHLPWAGMVHNAIPVDDYPFQAEKEDFCLFLGRISPEKAPDLAIKAARAAGRPIVVAAKCNERAEQSYFEERVRPLLGRDAVWFGEANQEQKKDLLARARCLIFPIQWNEPFGIVMVEAMACGTPVVALRDGSVPEIIDDGVTGYVCDSVMELPRAIARTDDLEPKLCRQHVANYFDVPTMAAAYETIYQDVIAPVAPLAASRPQRPSRLDRGRCGRSG